MHMHVWMTYDSVGRLFQLFQSSHVSFKSAVRQRISEEASITRPVQCNEGAPDHPAVHEAILCEVRGDVGCGEQDMMGGRGI